MTARTAAPVSAVVSAVFGAYGAALARRAADSQAADAYRASMTAIGRAIADGTSANSIMTACKAEVARLKMTADDKKSDDFSAIVPTSSGAIGYMQRIGAFLLLPGAADLPAYAATAAITYLCQHGGKAGVDAVLTTDGTDAATALTALRKAEQAARQAANQKAAEEKAAKKAAKETADTDGEGEGEAVLLTETETAAGLLRAVMATVGKAAGMAWDDAARDAATALLSTLETALADHAATDATVDATV